MTPRTVILGVDALGFNQVRRFVNEGLCPNFLAMNRAGYTAGLATSTPSISAPAWTSLVTGKWPGRHGIHHFFRSEYAAPGSYRRQLIDSRYVAARALPLWDILEQNGIACGLYRVPFTYPLPRVSGFCVGNDFASTTRRGDDVFPAGLKAELDAAGTRAGEAVIREMFGAAPGEFPEPLRAILSEMAREREEILHLVRRRREVPFQFYASTALDDIQHHFDRFHPVANWTHPARNDPYEITTPAARLRHVVPAAHCWYDRLAGEIRAELGPDDTFLIVSDHGSSPAQWLFSLNRWLWREGYLALRKDPDAAWGERGSGLLDLVDWDRTRACATPDFGLIVNRRGREPRGIVADAECPALRTGLAAELRSLRGPFSDQPVLRVHFPEEIYDGPYARQGPDLVVTSNALENGGVIVIQHLSDLEYRHQYALSDRISGAHYTGDDEQAVILAVGPGFQRAPGEPGPFRLTDLVPTLCLRFGIPLPDDSDGWFYANLAPGREQFSHRHYPPAGAESAPGATAAVADRLRGLGYID